MDVALNKAYTEVNIILDLLGDKYKSKLPKQLIMLFKEYQDANYKPNIEALPIDSLEISREALVIISILNLKYWETDEEKKKELKELYKQNQIDYQKKMGLYNLNKLF